MIDETLTLVIFGYSSDDLSRGSNKRVVAVCERCFTIRDVAYRKYRDLCTSCAQIGRRHSDDTKQKIGDAQRGSKNHAFGKFGDKNPNWKGGISITKGAIYNSVAYKNWRRAVFERDHFTCRMCEDGTGGNLQAHHIQPVREHRNDLSMFDINNGVTLCKKCHESVYKHESEYEMVGTLYRRIEESGDG